MVLCLVLHFVASSSLGRDRGRGNTTGFSSQQSERDFGKNSQ